MFVACLVHQIVNINEKQLMFVACLVHQIVNINEK